MSSPPSVIPRAGEIAFAISVSTLYDLTVGQVNWPVWFRKTNRIDPMDPALTLTNAVDGGACLDILNWDNTEVVTRFTNRGIYQTEVGGWIDFHYQIDDSVVPPEPADPPELAPDAEMIRMYAKDGRLWFLLPGNPLPQLIPTDAPTAPQARYAYWMAGG